MTREFTHEQRQAWLTRLPKRISSAGMILEDEQGRILIVKANYKNYWTLPGGIIDPGETPLEAAVRETQEEVGLTIAPHDVAFSLVANRKGDDAETYQFVFQASLPKNAEQLIVLQASEIDEYMYVSKADVRTNERVYAKAVEHWADGLTGYVEQTFDRS